VTAFERAAAGYDDQHEADLTAALCTAIAEVSVVPLDDQRALVLRTGEIVAALVTTLAMILSLSPEAVRSPTAIRHLTDELGKKLRRRVAAARASAEVKDFRDRSFRSDDGQRGG
jgi:hypothetical protein